MFSRALHDIFPTKARLSRFINFETRNCYIWDHEAETLHHLLLCCPLSKLVWWNLPWHIRTKHFQQLSASEWIMQILGNNDVFQLQVHEKLRMKHFLATTIEQHHITENQLIPCELLEEMRKKT